MNKSPLFSALNWITGLAARFNIRNTLLFIVEDNVIYSTALRSFITARFPSIKIAMFSNGEDCLLQLHRNPTIVIMDHLLNPGSRNGENGLSVIKKIKQHRVDTRIILLSAQQELNVFVEALALYDCVYLPKDEHAFGKVERFIRSIQ